jgi:hypothetical protein
MDFGVIADAESILFQEGVTLAPMAWEGSAAADGVFQHGALTVIPTAGARDLEAGRLAGVVVAGSTDPRAAEEQQSLEKLVQAAHAVKLPVMAFGEGAARALEALGFDVPADLPPAVLIHDGVRILETSEQVRDAIGALHTAQAALQAAA